MANKDSQQKQIFSCWPFHRSWNSLPSPELGKMKTFERNVIKPRNVSERQALNKSSFNFYSQLVRRWIFSEENFGAKSWWEQFKPHCSPPACTSSTKIPHTAFCGCLKLATFNRAISKRVKEYSNFRRGKKTEKTNTWMQPGENGCKLMHYSD